MKHLKPRNIERPMHRSERSMPDFAPVGKKDCEGICNREVIMTKDGPVIICHGCMRIVMDNRK